MDPTKQQQPLTGPLTATLPPAPVPPTTASTAQAAKAATTVPKIRLVASAGGGGGGGGGGGSALLPAGAGAAAAVGAAAVTAPTSKRKKKAKMPIDAEYTPPSTSGAGAGGSAYADGKEGTGKTKGKVRKPATGKKARTGANGKKGAAGGIEAPGMQRMRGKTIERSFVYGTSAIWQGKDSPDDATHRWTVYVRGPEGEDLTPWLKKVMFKLHSSFDNPNRVILKPPFEVTEVGWGEFEIIVVLYFQDPTERPLEMYHLLKLFPPLDQPQYTKTPVVSEQYDEVVFVDPREWFYKKLYPPHQPKSLAKSLLFGSPRHFISYSDQGDLKKIVEAQKRVREAIAAERERYAKVDEEAKIYSRAVVTVELASKIPEDTLPTTSPLAYPSPSPLPGGTGTPTGAAARSPIRPSQQLAGVKRPLE